MSYQYDFIVIGGGAAGLTAAGMGANFGAKTLMIEADKLGGDCTWTGCVPSKTLLHASKLAAGIKEAEAFGHQSAKPLNFSAILKHVRKVREEVYEEADDPDIYRDMGVEIEFGTARFVDDHTLAIYNEEKTTIKEVKGRYILIATGSKAMVPPIKGLDEVSYLTNESIFELEEQPDRLTIIGGGPIGIEMAQAFQRLGTQVTVFDMQDRILSNDDEELAGMLLKRLKSEGVEFQLSAGVNEISQNEDGSVLVHVEIDGEEITQDGDALLVAVGRAANYKSLNLDEAGVHYSKRGITVSDRCKTNISHIYAAGDVTGRYQFTHMSEHMAKVAASNAILKVPMKIDTEHVPWSTYTDPELASVGATQRQLVENSTSFETYRFPYSKVDRAITDGDTDGLIKIFAKKWNGKILGATIYGKQGGDLIGEYALAMKNGVTLRNIADTIHPYPTYGLGVRRAADQWYVKNQSEWMSKLVKKVFRYQGEIPDLSDKNRIV
ncbi:dihydrolipoyl dehydrogenase family protein [Rhodohalobacter sulfatireducens]|uniref:FAD-dependent oxidoreductase n=1 Tax=Rhodohalobacter sulfatireducens TaxID=2911366 RepID=A0ABS9KEH8_9BACT|nr:FAD-dependent oxidoreductase [Rhodohalobacter sulfatireducens]MCG2589257.1 FAD-dependent oxidoreductase [Rhodohalobacter sulfatireducens]